MEPESTEWIFPKDRRTNEIKNEIYEIKKWEEKIKCEDLKYETRNYTWFSAVWNNKIFWWSWDRPKQYIKKYSRIL